jgi:ADP-ribose pyrophosphatase YjhB (NUDIX family)
MQRTTRISSNAAGRRRRGRRHDRPRAAGAPRQEPLKGHWTLPGGVLEVGETLAEASRAKCAKKPDSEVEAVELVELLDRIHREEGRVRYHYVIADYLCRVTGGELRAASDATDDVRWVERAEWNSHSALKLGPDHRARHRKRLATSAGGTCERPGGDSCSRPRRPR